jgi:1-acyl-sn-glycerol-3-phosphate acyltransferase
MDILKIVESPAFGTKLASLVAIVLMNILVPLLMILETLIGILLFPVGLLVWRLITRWPLAKIMRHFVWIYGRVWMWIVTPFVRFEVVGADPAWATQPTMYVANHLSFLDIFCLAAMPVFDVIICLRSWPFKMVWFAPFMRLAQYIDLESLPWDTIVIQSSRFFKEGRSMLVFPQGHRSRDRQIGRFYSGAFRLAMQFNVPIIPICITGTDNVCPPGRRSLRPSRIRIECLDPIAPAQFPGELGHIKLRRHVKEKMEACLANTPA